LSSCPLSSAERGGGGSDARACTVYNIQTFCKKTEVYMAPGMKGLTGYARDFEKQTGRYIIDMETAVNGRTEYALHPRHLEPLEKVAPKDEL